VLRRPFSWSVVTMLIDSEADVESLVSSRFGAAGSVRSVEMDSRKSGRGPDHARCAAGAADLDCDWLQLYRLDRHLVRADLVVDLSNGSGATSPTRWLSAAPADVEALVAGWVELDAAETAPWVAPPVERGAAICVRLGLEDQPTGLLWLGRTAGAPFTRAEVRRAVAFAGEAGRWLEPGPSASPGRPRLAAEFHTARPDAWSVRPASMHDDGAACLAVTHHPDGLVPVDPARLAGVQRALIESRQEPFEHRVRVLRETEPLGALGRPWSLVAAAWSERDSAVVVAALGQAAAVLLGPEGVVPQFGPEEPRSKTPGARLNLDRISVPAGTALVLALAERPAWPWSDAELHRAAAEPGATEGPVGAAFAPGLLRRG
jgi:hypothetical protein